MVLRWLAAAFVNIIAARAFGGEVAGGGEAEIDCGFALRFGKDYRAVYRPAF